MQEGSSVDQATRRSLPQHIIALRSAFAALRRHVAAVGGQEFPGGGAEAGAGPAPSAAAAAASVLFTPRHGALVWAKYGRLVWPVKARGASAQCPTSRLVASLGSLRKSSLLECSFVTCFSPRCTEGRTPQLNDSASALLPQVCDIDSVGADIIRALAKNKDCPQARCADTFSARLSLDRAGCSA